MIIQAIAPVLAPVVGGVISAPFGWRAVFWALAVINAAQVLVVVLGIRESRPVAERTGVGLAGMLSNYLHVLRNPRFLAYAMVLAVSFGAMFSYISASPFVLQNQLGMTPVMFSVVFAVNSFALMLSGFLNRRLLNSVHPHRIMAWAMVGFISLNVILLVQVALIRSTPLFLVLLFLIIAHVPLIMANATALGTAVVWERAGSGSAVMGFLQFSMGGLISPVVGLGSDRALSMAVAMVVCSVGAGVAVWVAGRHPLPEMN